MKTILIVDDEPAIAAALELRFKAAGYSTMVAGDAATGLSRAVERKPDLILMDVSLPAGDGLEVARKLRKLPETRSIPIIFITASKDPGLRGKAMDLGAAGLFEKPYDPEELLAVAGHALGETSVFSRPSARSAPEHPLLNPGAGPASAKKILIVEDDRKIAMALALRLQAAGYETLIAGDAVAGVSTAVKSLPNLVLLDISLPAGNGFTVAERMKTALPNPVPVIFLTASKQPGFRDRARELGAAGYFEKPYEAEDLLAAVRQRIGA
jgi:DNA-binding response OmpR family regulator